jgi:hypothetical protein
MEISGCGTANTSSVTVRPGARWRVTSRVTPSWAGCCWRAASSACCSSGPKPTGRGLPPIPSCCPPRCRRAPDLAAPARRALRPGCHRRSVCFPSVLGLPMPASAERWSRNALTRLAAFSALRRARPIFGVPLVPPSRLTASHDSRSLAFALLQAIGPGQKRARAWRYPERVHVTIASP